MKDIVKIQLSPEEAGLINNTEWILTKHNIVNKIYEMFGGLNQMMKNVLTTDNIITEDLQLMNGKISKGENYRQLPYVILDYPAQFSKNNIFAVRTMFWWGNFFSITLHLSGMYKERYINNKTLLLSFLQKNNFCICINTQEWQHHFEEDNYKPAINVTDDLFAKVIEQSFFKVAKQLPVKEWNYANEFLLKTFKEILGLLKINYPNDKKDLSPVSPTTGSGL